MAYYFMVDTYIKDGERGEYDEYIRRVKPIVEKYGGEYLVRTQEVQSLSACRTPQRLIVIRFPEKEALENCFASEEYRQIMEKRIRSVDARAVIAPGV